MSRLLLSIALFGVLLGSAMARMGLGMWESTSQQENVEEYLKAIHGNDKVAQFYQKNSKILTGWSYNDHTDYFVHWMRFLPSNVSASFGYRGEHPGVVAFGDDIVEYSFTAEAEGETGVLHGKFKLRGTDKSWTKDYEFKEDGNMQVTAKVGDVTAKILFRPTLSARAQGEWEATSEGKNLDKLGEIFKHQTWPKDEKFRVCIKREGDHYVKTVNISNKIHQHEFKVNKDGSFKIGDKEVKYTAKYDMALDTVKAKLTGPDGDEIKIKYTHDERGAYGTYKKGDIEVQRFYRRLIPEELLGTYEFSGKQVNAETFHKALLGGDKSKHNYSGSKKIELKCEGDKYSETVHYEGGKKMKFDFLLGELGHTTSPNGTHLDYFYSYHTKMGRKVLRGDFWSTDKPHRYFNINFELEGDKDLVLTYHLDHVVAKRWFKKTDDSKKA